MFCPPPSIVEAGCPAIYAYLRDVEKGHELLTRSRLVFIGDGGVGKTTLKTALLMLHDIDRFDVLKEVRSTLKSSFQKYTEADFRQWVDHDLAHRDGFFDEECPRAKGITGKLWLKSTDDQLQQWFGSANTPASEDVVQRMLQAKRFLLSKGSKSSSSKDSGSPFQQLLHMPHVWTEGIDVDHWIKHAFDLWDFAGQLEFFPAHQLFMASHMAVYLLVFDASKGLEHSIARISVWLGLLQACRLSRHKQAEAVQVRLVATKTDLPSFDFELQHLHAVVQERVGSEYHLGHCCFAPRYDEHDIGDAGADFGLVALDEELATLRREGVPYVQVPTAYLSIKNCVQSMKTEQHQVWPIISVSKIDFRDKDPDLILRFLDDAGVVRRIPDDEGRCVLEPVTWLSKLMAALLHPLHGLGLTTAQAGTASTAIFVPGVSVLQAVNALEKRSIRIPQHAQDDLLPFLSSFGVCFELKRGRFTFPSLLPHHDPHSTIIESMGRLLGDAEDCVILGRRLQCAASERCLPPTCWPAVVRSLCQGLQDVTATLLHLSAGIFVAVDSNSNYLALCTTDVTEGRALDVIVVGGNKELLNFAMLTVVNTLCHEFPHVQLQKRCLKATKTMDPLGVAHPLLRRRVRSYPADTALLQATVQNSQFGTGVLARAYYQCVINSPLFERTDGGIQLHSSLWSLMLTDPRFVQEDLRSCLKHSSSEAAWPNAECSVGDLTVTSKLWKDGAFGPNAYRGRFQHSATRIVAVWAVSQPASCNPFSGLHGLPEALLRHESPKLHRTNDVLFIPTLMPAHSVPLGTSVLTQCDADNLRELIRDITNALVFLHERQVLHGSLCPEHIVCHRSQDMYRAQIAAYNLGLKPTSDAWLAPEQRAAACPHLPSREADVFAFGKLIDFIRKRGNDDSSVDHPNAFELAAADAVVYLTAENVRERPGLNKCQRPAEQGGLFLFQDHTASGVVERCLLPALELSELFQSCNDVPPSKWVLLGQEAIQSQSDFIQQWQSNPTRVTGWRQTVQAVAPKLMTKLHQQLMKVTCSPTPYDDTFPALMRCFRNVCHHPEDYDLKQLGVPQLVGPDSGLSKQQLFWFLAELFPSLFLDLHVFRVGGLPRKARDAYRQLQQYPEPIPLLKHTPSKHVIEGFTILCEARFINPSQGIGLHFKWSATGGTIDNSVVSNNDLVLTAQMSFTLPLIAAHGTSPIVITCEATHPTTQKRCTVQVMKIELDQMPGCRWCVRGPCLKDKVLLTPDVSQPGVFTYSIGSNDLRAPKKPKDPFSPFTCLREVACQDEHSTSSPTLKWQSQGTFVSDTMSQQDWKNNWSQEFEFALHFDETNGSARLIMRRGSTEQTLECGRRN
ncbi:serine/threonine protein kinase [Salpingoeca rosetta]|uniref:Serine/threonine protein kinase n=1 Tax=Salpingoeca rosetta (strain ATCC 50818 / BSB-021) TaxID=946362 RepID=F2U0W5_SALR5|nr:serine/threonine protein kinase [Salpingoeca rosetta]EGD80539.1 serine/threonine protein kinase [Salpingoeca rosetta]|eukprot:XP_004997100.1 serine/threonine protein kinase [Salpingoeca rosetta]